MIRQWRYRRSIPALAVVAFFLASGSATHAADARFERVILVSAADRVSLVIELSSEPTHVETRRVSGTVLELDAGPLAVPVRPAVLTAPRGTRFIADVSIRPGVRTSDGASLRARIALLELSRSGVRIVGRRVYVDFSADQPYRQAPEPRKPALSTPPIAVAAAREQSGGHAYQTAVRPAIGRLEQLAPFLMSATGEPTAPVLKAVGDTLSTVNQSMQSVEVPPESRHAHDALTAAIALAVRAVDPLFAGDRVAQARQALAELDRAKAELNKGS